MLKPSFLRKLLPFLLVLLPACQPVSPVQTALKELDQTLAREAEITLWKESRISNLLTKLQRSSDAREQYRLCDQLYAEYEKYNLDSALSLAHRKEAIARQLEDPQLITDAALDLGSRYLISGMYSHAQKVLETMDLNESLRPAFKMTYYQLLTSLHHGLKITNKDPAFAEELDRQEHQYRNQFFNAADSTMTFYHTYRAENDIDRGHPELGRKRLEEVLATRTLSPDEKAILHYCIAKTYKLEKQMDKALTHYAISARLDLEQGVRASRSLIQTARIVNDNGQTKQAFSYITRAYEDATLADARVCLEEIAAFMPDITSAYDRQNKRRYNQILFTLVLLAIFLVASMVGLIFVRRLQVQLLHSKQEIESINQNLQVQLLRVKDANDIKDSYLGRYLSMFSSHINSLEQYRSLLRNVAKGKDLNEILQTLRSDDFIEEKREALYTEFDHTFLGVFPDFVPQLNALLKNGHHIGEDLPKGKLTNELRIFALIRLGVSESAQIAKFLKKSPSTIYNYRVKLRNAAICPNEEFEKRLREIGK